jgi:excisionase family DNA binding protein
MAMPLSKALLPVVFEQRYLSLRQTAEYLGLSRKTVYGWAENNRMPAYKLGRVWRFDRAELDQFVRGQRPPCQGDSKMATISPECSGPERKGR